ncbi:family 16 glycosylhydrolase [Fodinibius sp. Rm-B-1B1-1]|uniref:family 16 glycosylhydrolase n=1 Tax=Fodinibius alkaliphilus TaxID=3140241 RepID=UPI00315A8E0E
MGKKKCKTFGKMNGDNSQKRIEQIYVINLDRQPQRWKQTIQELSNILDSNDKPLSDLTTRISAIDASQFDKSMDIDVVNRTYTLGDQLFVEPRQTLPSQLDLDKQIEMTEQEIAVAQSHIKTWRKIANGNDKYALVLEDDVGIRLNFANYVDQIWQQICSYQDKSSLFDILYLSYKEVENGAEKHPITKDVFKLFRGLWFLSGYVISKKGAKKLLDFLPICGPVDLWINHKFNEITALTASESVIFQRMDQNSENSYSVLPALSEIGVLNNEAPSLFQAPSLVKPIFAIGTKNSGLTSLSMALSMLGYRCCSDLDDLPNEEKNKLISKGKPRIFDAYVNIGFVEKYLSKLSKLYPEAKLIIAIDSGSNIDISKYIDGWSERFLVLPSTEQRKWKLLCEFLGTVPPASPYPSLPEKGKRMISQHNRKRSKKNSSVQKLKSDSLPWIVSSKNGWNGIPLNTELKSSFATSKNSIRISSNFDQLDKSTWFLREDTFPGNLALFKPSNIYLNNDAPTEIYVRQENMKVRNYSSGALTTHTEFLFGRFEAILKPPKTTGLITGLFLHRNSPRQEVDIEFLGKYPQKLLLNVFYNPGDEGARFDYGYRGTPILVNLGFDVTNDFHSYAIEWEPDELRWFVDDQLIHRRVNWNPTPIPHLPMKFHVNHWPSKSRELAGKLSNKSLPSSTLLKSVELATSQMNC